VTSRNTGKINTSDKIILENQKKRRKYAYVHVEYSFTTRVDMTENKKYSIKYKQNANYRLLDREGEK